MTWIRPYIETITGVILGVVTIVIWTSTFCVLPDLDYAPRLFPLMCFVLERRGLYPPMYIPLTFWYLGAFTHWFLPGVCVDLVRWAFRFCRRSQVNLKTFGRWLALAGIGWAILMPLCLYWRVPYDGQAERIRRLRGDIYGGIYPWRARTDRRQELERQAQEAGILAEREDREFERYALATVFSSVGFIVLSGYVFRVCRKNQDTAA